MKKTFAGSIPLYDTLLRNKTILATYLPAVSAPAYDEPSAFYGGQTVNKDLADWASQIPSVNTGAYSAEAQSALSSVTPRILSGGDMSVLLAEAEKNFQSKM
jgi:lactose/L-arabinose transport system substrate-binding protein